MSQKQHLREYKRATRRKRVRARVHGTNDLPRLCVFRSHRYTYAQIISDESGKTLCCASTKKHVADGKSTRCRESAKELGKKLAQLAKEMKIQRVIFDRNGYLYHGRVAAVAEGAREGGLKF